MSDCVCSFQTAIVLNKLYVAIVLNKLYVAKKKWCAGLILCIAGT